MYTTPSRLSLRLESTTSYCINFSKLWCSSELESRRRKNKARNSQLASIMVSLSSRTLIEHLQFTNQTMISFSRVCDFLFFCFGFCSQSRCTRISGISSARSSATRFPRLQRSVPRILHVVPCSICFPGIFPESFVWTGFLPFCQQTQKQTI